MIVFVTKYDFEIAKEYDCEPLYYLTLEDLFDYEGIVEFVKVDIPEVTNYSSTNNSIDVSNIEIDLDDINMN